MPEYPFPVDAPDSIWSATDITAIICQPGCMSPDDWRAVTFCAVTLGESGGLPTQVSKPNWAPGTPHHLSVDLGLFQLNSYYNVEVDPFPDLPAISIEECLTPGPAWGQTWKLLNKERTGWGYNMTWWSAYKNGSYQRYVPVALSGIRQYRNIMGLGPGPF